MLFNSLHFFIYFPIVVVLYFSMPHRFRWIFLLIASYYFYMAWEPAYGLLIFGSTVLDYCIGIVIENSTTQTWKKRFIFLSLVANLGLLFFFKYFDFFFDSITPLVKLFQIDFMRPLFHVLLPVGISFYTFQSLSYTLDVYRGARKAERHFGIFALYVSFFPQLVAGPIETASHLLPQFYKKMEPDAGRFVSGLRLMLWGFFKKIVIADNAAMITNAVFNQWEHANGITLMVGIIFFAIQIYTDFSGYTDIARGAARILGFDLMLNFRRPYFARSIAEFWQRWHISLTSWFQHYVFTPLYLSIMRSKRTSTLATKQKHTLAFVSATFIGLTLLGLWHGAGMHFVLFGVSQALFIISYHFTKKYWDAFPFWLANGLTLIMVLIGFIFFRVQDVHEAFSVIYRIVVTLYTSVLSPSTLPSLVRETGFAMGVNRYEFFSLIGASIFLFGTEAVLEKQQSARLFTQLPRYLRWSLYYALIFLIIFTGRFGDAAFIYFQF